MRIKEIMKSFVKRLPGVKALLNRYRIIDDKLSKIYSISAKNEKLLETVLNEQLSNNELLHQILNEEAILKSTYEMIDAENKKLYYEAIQNQCKKIETTILEKVDCDVKEVLSNSSAFFADTKKQLSVITKASNESVWGAVYHDAILNSDWLKDKKIFPGRWAVGYQYLYPLYRILDEFQPKRILELGLGQSTRVIGQYVEAQDAVEHIIIEHDSEYAEKFKQNFALSNRSKLQIMELTKKTLDEDDSITAYRDFSETLKNRKFDLISIDGPFGYPTKKYARIDVLEMIPDCLEPEFVIMMDDYNRAGEKHTFNVMQKKLEEAGIECFRGVYSGNKDTGVLVSKNNRFLCTM